MFKKKKVVILSFDNDFNIDAIGTHLQNIVQVKISIDNDVHQWAQKEYEFTSSGILCTNHINCRDQLCVNLDTGELIPERSQKEGNRVKSIHAWCAISTIR